MSHGNSAAAERRIAWLFSAAGVVPAVLAAMQQYVLGELDGESRSWNSLAFTGGDWLALGLLAPVAYRVGRRFSLRRGARRLALHAGGAVLFAIAWASLGMLL